MLLKSNTSRTLSIKVLSLGGKYVFVNKQDPAEKRESSRAGVVKFTDLHLS